MLLLSLLLRPTAACPYLEKKKRPDPKRPNPYVDNKNTYLDNPNLYIQPVYIRNCQPRSQGALTAGGVRWKKSSYHNRRW